MGGGNRLLHELQYGLGGTDAPPHGGGGGAEQRDALQEGWFRILSSFGIGNCQSPIPIYLRSAGGLFFSGLISVIGSNLKFETVAIRAPGVSVRTLVVPRVV